MINQREVEKTQRRYRVVLARPLDVNLQSWFEGLSITVERGTTVLTGVMQDQTELHGLLRKIHDLQLTLLSLELLDTFTPNERNTP